jgi:signal transduction histidine kinase
LRRFRVLHRAGRELANISDLSQVDEAYEIVIRLAYEHSGSQTVIRREDRADASLVVVRSIAEHPIVPVPRLPRGMGVTGLAVERGVAQVVDDVDTWELGEVMRANPPEATLVVVPIFLKERVYGTLTLMHNEPYHFVHADVELFEGLAQQLALTLNRLETIRAQQDNDVMVEIGHFSTELAHRLGNYLGFIGPQINTLRNELARLGVLNESLTAQLNQMVEDRNRAAALVKRLQSLRAPNSDARSELTDVRAFLDEVVHSSLPPQPDIVVRIEAPPELPPAIANREQVSHIVANLFTNAVQALDTGGEVLLRAYASEQFLAIEISDTGKGIPEQDRERIFDLFFSTKPDGTGFGLWSARRYARANKGDLICKSTQGRGATFTLLLPQSQH